MPHHLLVAQTKFFARSGRRFFFKAMRLDGVGSTLDLNEKLKLRSRLEGLKDAHTTGLILTEAQSQPALDIVAAAGMVAMVELIVTLADLLDYGRFASTVSRLAHIANIYRSHSGLCGYLIDRRISDAVSTEELSNSDVKKMRRRLRVLLLTLREHDSQALLAIKHRAGDDIPFLPEESFLYFETSPVAAAELPSRVEHLHQLAGARPVVIDFTEVSKGQDDAVREAFGTGAAGVVAPPMPGSHVRDWLRIRALRAADVMPFVALNGSCPPQPQRTPLVSVVVCVRNAERTIARCLEALSGLAYPNYEIIVIDDGSNDRTTAIAAEFAKVRVIRQPRKGFGAARNAGLNLARGQFIAFISADCIVDSHWLTFIVRKMQEDRLDACGGAVYSAADSSPVAETAAAAAQALSREEGCLADANLVFARDTLERVGGFDAQFTAAGEELDVLARMHKAGLRGGHSPAAFMSYLDSASVKGYLGDQAAHGRADAMLHRRYPDRFGGRAEAGQTRRYLKRWLRSGDWMICWGVVALACVVLGVSTTPALAMLGLGAASAFVRAWRAPLAKGHRGASARIAVTLLLCAGSMCRTVARYWAMLHRYQPEYESVARRATHLAQHHATIH